MEKERTEIQDRIGMYLVPHLADYIFDELSDSYLERAGVKDIMSGVPVPVNKDATSGVSVIMLAMNMAFVIGCDPNFEHRDSYIKYILRNFDERFAELLISEGIKSIEKNDYDYAAIMFRASFMVDPELADAYYFYGRACKLSYEEGVEEEFVGRFKAEALEAFETATLKNDKMTEAFYYLGYAYVNMGLYIKAKLTWEDYIKLVDEDMKNPELDEAILKEYEEGKTEIQERLTQLEEPVKIEEGYNMVLSNRFEEGISILEKYTEGQFKEWWPLWFYLGTAYRGIGAPEEAVKCFREVLKFSPSNEDAIEQMTELCEEIGDEEGLKKYSAKLDIVKANREKDREDKMKNAEQEMKTLFS